MRTRANFQKLLPKYLKDKFPPRICEDLAKIPMPKDLRNVAPVQNTFIFGPVQTGKTIRAAQMLVKELEYIYLKEIGGAHNGTIFISFSEMLQDIKRTYSTTATEGEQEVLINYLDAHLLVIDDFISARPTDWVMETLYFIINYRYENKLSTIITSNHNLEELETILNDQRITSRINRAYKLEEKTKYR